MKTYTVEIDGMLLTILQDVDGAFLIPDGWRGIGTALKPANEPIVLARKPLSESTVALNCLRWGTGALNVDATRIPTDWKSERGETWLRSGNNSDDAKNYMGRHGTESGSVADRVSPLGRWPANLILEGDENGKPVEEVLAGFPETGVSSGGTGASTQPLHMSRQAGTLHPVNERANAGGLGDSGSAARFFYTAKADSDDRCGSRHPTIKPVDLMQYLVRLVTPKGGVVLDPFAGSGTTGEAAIREGMRAILIEREPQYVEDIQRRLSLALAGPEERARAIIKASGKEEPVDDLPLFGKSTEAA